jgi:hypothetical protein
MKAIVGHLLGAVVLALIGGVCLAAGLLDREMGHAQEHLAAQEYNEPEAIFENVEPYFEYSSRVPGIGNGPLNDVRARRASAQYWQRNYATIVPEVTDPVASIPSDNVAQQLIVANSIFRIGQAEAKDRTSMLQMLDAGILGYQTVLKNVAQQDAAYNYEYLVRLRDELQKGRRKGQGDEPTDDGQHGQAGGPPPSTNMEKFKVYIPLDPSEREKAGEAGKGAPIKRKG